MLLISRTSVVASLITVIVLSASATIGQQYQSSSPKMFCYYSTYAQNRPGDGQFLPEDIDPELCTHIIMAFADIIQGTQLKASGYNDLPNGKDSGIYARTQALKQSNPNLKILLAVGGWRAGSEPFVAIVDSESNMKTFTDNAVTFLRRHNFDGLDIDWEFPGSRGSGPEHKPLFTKLLKELREAFENEASDTGKDRLLLTMASAGGSYYIELAYEPSKIIKYVDYLLIMAYNYHGSWNKFTGHHSGLFPRSDEVGGEREWNQAWTINYWLNKAGAPKEKMIVGISTYGTTFTLASSSQHGLKAVTSGPGEAGKFTKEAGTLAYYEMCENLRQGWNSVWIEEQKVPYAYHEDQWVGYDNLDSVTTKAQYLRQKGIGGAFIWSLEMDDFRGSCGTGKFPLLTAIVTALSGDSSLHATSNSDLSDSNKPLYRSNTDYQPRSASPRSSQRYLELPPSRSTTGSSRSRFAEIGSTSEVVHSARDAGDARGRYSIRGSSSGDSSIERRALQRSRGVAEYDDTSRRQLAATKYDDVVSTGSRSQHNRQELDFNRQEDDSFRNRKYAGANTGNNGRSLSRDDDVTTARGGGNVGRRTSSYSTLRKNDDFDGRRNADVLDSFVLQSHVPASRSRPSHASSFSDSSVCSTSGVFVKTGTSCRAYYVCVQHGSSWHQFHMSCPHGTTFRTDLAACSDVIAGDATSNICAE